MESLFCWMKSLFVSGNFAVAMNRSFEVSKVVVLKWHVIFQETTPVLTLSAHLSHNINKSIRFCGWYGRVFFVSVPENGSSCLNFSAFLWNLCDLCLWNQKKMIELDYITFLSDADFLQHSQTKTVLMLLNGSFLWLRNMQGMQGITTIQYPNCIVKQFTSIHHHGNNCGMWPFSFPANSIALERVPEMMSTLEIQHRY